MLLLWTQASTFDLKNYFKVHAGCYIVRPFYRLLSDIPIYERTRVLSYCDYTSADQIDRKQQETFGRSTQRETLRVRRWQL